MPTYVYRRDDGTEFELEQRISEDPLTVCPETGRNVRRVIHLTPMWQRGSGWASKDFKSEDTAKKALAKDPLHTTLPEYTDKKKEFDERTGRDLKLKGPRVYQSG